MTFEYDENQLLVPLSKTIFWVQAPGRGKFPFCNSFLIVDEEIVLVDAGIGEEKIREIDEIHRIDRLLVSHSHPDHILFWDRLRDRHLMMPKETPDVITDLIELGTRFTGNSADAVPWKKRIGDGLGLKPMRLPDSRFQDGEVLSFGQTELKAIRAPGHLIDHYCFLELKSGLLLTTDIDFDAFGPWYGNPECSISQFRENIQTVKELPFTSVCSSHKPPLGRDQGLKAFEEYERLFEKQARLVWDLCQEPITTERLIAASPFYRNRMPDKNIQRIFENQMILKNLDLLLANGQLKKEGDLYLQAQS